MLAQHQALQFTASKSDSLEEREFAAPFQHIAQHHNAEAEAPKQQAEAAERLEDCDVGVFDFVKMGKPPPRWNDLQPSIAQRSGKLVRNGSRILRRGINQQHAVPSARRETLDEVALGDDETTLQKGVRIMPTIRRWNEFPRSSTYAIVSPTFFEGPPHGRFVADRRHGAVLLRLVEQRPFAGECPSPLELFRIDRQQARLLRALRFKQLASSPSRTRMPTTLTFLITARRLRMPLSPQAC